MGGGGRRGLTDEEKKKKKTAENLHSKLPNIIPVSKCRLRLLR